MKGVNIEQIMSFHPCDKYPEDRIIKLMGRKKSITIKDVLKIKLDGYEDNLWLALRLEFIPEKKLHKIAIYAAEMVLPIFEKEYPDDDRPRKAIEAKKLWLKNKITDNELAAARAAAGAAGAAAGAAGNAAWDARDAARAAGDAARAAAWDAAGDAAGAAWDAAGAAGDAAWAAAGDARDAARAATLKKIINYIKKIMEVKI